MGLVADPGGISVQLYDANNQPLGNPYFGRSTHLCSVKRPDGTAAQPLSAEEALVPGSADWLTEVAVADTDDRLAEIAPVAMRASSCALSSCASHRVKIKLFFDGMATPRILDGRTVIASGPVVPRTPPATPANPNPVVEHQVRVVHIKVFDPARPMDPSHPMIDEFVGWASEHAALSSI